MAKNDSYLSDLALDSVPDQVTLASGTEAQVEIIQAVLRKSDKGNTYISLMLQPQSDNADEDIKPCSYNFLTLPKEGDTSAKINSKRRTLKEFCDVFGITYSSLYDYVSMAEDQLLQNPDDVDKWEDVKGLSAWAILGEREYEGKLSNYIKSWVIS